jgi:uncharacterized protein YcbK (DUF882 family)
MKFNEFRLVFWLKIVSFVFFSFIAIYFIGNNSRRTFLFSYFSTRCLDYKQKNFSRRLNDRIVDYSAEAKRKGIQACKDDHELKKAISDGRLIKARSGNKYIIEVMTYSYPYVTPDTRRLLDEIGVRFREKTSKKGLRGARFFVTSMTRKTENVKSLRRSNQNASANSPHMYGNALDISYKRFFVRKWGLTNCDEKFLKEAMAEVIWQLRTERKCWATYERGQSCFHVVAR